MPTERKPPRQTPFGAAEVIVDLFQKKKSVTDAPPASPEKRALRARRAGLFRVPASIAGPTSEVRKAVAARFKHHLKSVSGANRLGQDPDESVPVVKRESGRGVNRPGFGFRRPPPSSSGGFSSFDTDDDDED